MEETEAQVKDVLSFESYDTIMGFLKRNYPDWELTKALRQQHTWWWKLFNHKSCWIGMCILPGYFLGSLISRQPFTSIQCSSGTFSCYFNSWVIIGMALFLGILFAWGMLHKDRRAGIGSPLHTRMGHSVCTVFKVTDLDGELLMAIKSGFWGKMTYYSLRDGEKIDV
jgi:hypothetical protein